ncbi:MAG: hypothetical protein ACTSXJ_02635 [Candidatus Baldrarchaeia archaeon]
MSLSIELPEEVRAKIEEFAKKIGINVSEFCKIILELWIKHEGRIVPGRVKGGIQRIAVEFPMGFVLLEKGPEGIKEIEKKVGVFTTRVNEQSYWEV